MNCNSLNYFVTILSSGAVAAIISSTLSYYYQGKSRKNDHKRDAYFHLEMILSSLKKYENIRDEPFICFSIYRDIDLLIDFQRKLSHIFIYNSVMPNDIKISLQKLDNIIKESINNYEQNLDNESYFLFNDGFKNYYEIEDIRKTIRGLLDKKYKKQ